MNEQNTTQLTGEEWLAAIEARANAATSGPWCTDSWEIYQGTEYVPGISMWIGETCRGMTSMEQDRADAAFVAAARTDVPALIAEVRELLLHTRTLEALVAEQAAEIDRLRATLAEQVVQIEKLQGLHTCPALATNLDRCCKTPGHSGDHSSFADRHIWSPAHAAEAAKLHHCTAEYGGPGYSHCELAAEHEGQHEAAMGNMRRATWGGDR